jgi:predicted metal-binding protein
MKQLDQYLEKALKAGVDDAMVVQTSKVHTAPWVRMKCQFGCRQYGQSHCCPPRTPTSDEMRRILDSYTHAILLHWNWKEGVKPIDEFNNAVVDTELALFLDGYYKAWSVGSGPCRLCEKCNISGQCVHGTKARPSMEACGIDVFRTVREHGLPVRVLKERSEERHGYGLVLVE